MQKLLIILIIILAGYTTADAQCMLKVSLTDKTVINVSVDSRYFNKGGTSVTVGDLPPGHHYLQVYAFVQDSRGRGRQRQIYEGKIKTSEGMITLFVLDPESGVPDIQFQNADSFISNHPLPPYTPNGNNGDNGNYDNGNNNGQPAAPAPVQTGTLTDNKTADMKIQVDATNTDTDKMKEIKEALKSETVTVAQVAGMMDWFNFESTKLDFVEWAYNITVDKENFDQLDSKFTYKEYQDSFEQFVKSKQ